MEMCFLPLQRMLSKLIYASTSTYYTRIHIYSIEELILCALPYHDSHVFVQVVQLIDTGNSKWKFVEGVKASGAPLPRKIIVQQSIRDFGILEVLCTYVTTSKKVEPSRPVTDFCSAVIFEVLRIRITHYYRQ